MKLHESYSKILNDALQSSVELNKRTGENVKVIEYPVNMTLDLRNNFVPTIGLRKTFPKSAAAETAWFLQGTQESSFIEKYAPFWNKFVEEIETPNGIIKGVKNSYGYRWRNHFGRDQIADAIVALKNDPTNRRVYISAWDAEEDGLTSKDQLNIPCPVGFNLCIVNGHLNSTITLRSSDIFVGLPYDIMGHAYLMDAIATSLEINVGFMSASLNHAHLYESHWEYALEALTQKIIVPELKLPNLSINEICSNPDKYVNDIIIESKNHQWPSFNPKPAIISQEGNNQELKKFINKKIENVTEKKISPTLKNPKP